MQRDKSEAVHSASARRLFRPSHHLGRKRHWLSWDGNCDISVDLRKPWNHSMSHLCFVFCFISKSQNKAVAPCHRTTSSVQKDCKSDVKFFSWIHLHMFLQLEGGACCFFFPSEIKMQYELPKLGLRKTKIKVRPCSNSLEMFKRRRWSLKNG